MSVSRKLDAQRLRSALSGKPMEHHTSDNSHHLTPASSVSTGEAGQPNHAADMPIMRLSKKDSAPDMRKLNSRRGQIPDFTGVPSSDGPLQSPLSHHPVSKSYGNSSTNGSRPYSPHEFPQSFDLAPPPPNRRLTTIDHLYERLFSEDHLYLILSDPTHFVRFTSFINKHRSQTALLLTRYLETQKAIKAIEYANAIANTIQPLPQDHSTFQPCAAALLDVRFEARSKRAFETLLNEGLTSYVTRVLVDAVTDTLIKEITGNTMPIMRDLVGGLAEVFCLTDPSLKDDPIVYASEEFYRTTQYGRDYVIGRNCRFLQGPKTDMPTIGRISTACKAGQEVCETVLNYRRDGSPFLNLLMIAPLYDNRGQVRYFIGAQVDVTGLVEDGKGIDSFERLLAEDRAKREAEADLDRKSNRSDEAKKPIEALGELGELLSWEETMEIQARSRSASLRDSSSFTSSSANLMREGVNIRNGNRRVLGNENDPEAVEKAAWGLSGSGLSGKLPGVYQNYLLVRPYPSLRIIFVSPSLRIPGLLQSHFLSRIGGPTSIRDGIEDAFAQGIPVTAKVAWLPLGKSAADDNDDDALLSDDQEPSHGGHLHRTHIAGRGPTTHYGSHAARHPPGEGVQPQQPRTRWLSCTPLLGSDDRPGVWMVVMVEDTNPTRVVGVRAAGLPSHSTHNSNSMERIDPAGIVAFPSQQQQQQHTNRHHHAARAPDRDVPRPKYMDSVRATETLRASANVGASDDPQALPPTRPRGLTHIPARTTSAALALAPARSPTLSPEAVEAWIPVANGETAAGGDSATAVAGVGNGLLSPNSQTQRAFAEFTAKMAAPRGAVLTVSDRGVDLRNGRVVDEGERRVGVGVGVAA
ncbi:hypothetical protein MMC34_003763 [Xylographa carneopallida]|nr:hypothetical protein [Xylographa carneopallida]